MRRVFPGCALVIALTVAGCSDEKARNSQAGGAGGDGAPNSGGLSAGGPTQAAPVSLSGGTAEINPDNTTIRFVGTKPDGRHDGGFTDFSGQISVVGESNILQKISVEIQTESLWADNPKLTNHLKSQDFFNVREHPTAKFESTTISWMFEPKDAADDEYQVGEYEITGNLTLLGNTREITFPAKVQVNESGLTLNSEFNIDRTQFGMTYGQNGRVDREVTINVAVGVKPAGAGASAANGSGGAGGGRRPGPGGPGGGRGGFDPNAFFDRRDADADGKLSGEEIPDRMRQSLNEIDKDGDGAVSREEFQERMKQFRGRGGRGGAGGRPGAPGGGGGRPPRPTGE